MNHQVPFYFQSAVHDCVPTCVLALSEFFHIPITLKKLRRVLVTDPAIGTPIKNLLNLQPYFEVQLGKIVNLEECPNYFPFVAYLNHGHAVVVWGYTDKGDGFIIGDPAIGVMQVPVEEFLRQWEGLCAVIRPHDGNGIAAAYQYTVRRVHWLLESLGHLKYLRVDWKPMLWVSVLISLLGVTNAMYSMYFARYLSDISTFAIFIGVCTVATGILHWAVSLAQARLDLKYSRILGQKIRDAFPHMDHRFYTMGDVSTRYNDVDIIIASVTGLFRDVPYALVIFGASLYFLSRISPLLAVFVIAFLILLVCVLSPFVNKVQYFMYTINLRESEMMNRLQRFMGGSNDAEQVTNAWEETNMTRYKQALWGIPIQSVVGNSAVLPILFVVLFMHWKTGGTSQYEEILSAIMIMNYAVDAGHTLYGRFVSWQTAQPSFHRLRDFLENDKEELEELHAS